MATLSRMTPSKTVSPFRKDVTALSQQPNASLSLCHSIVSARVGHCQESVGVLLQDGMTYCHCRNKKESSWVHLLQSLSCPRGQRGSEKEEKYCRFPQTNEHRLMIMWVLFPSLPTAESNRGGKKTRGSCGHRRTNPTLLSSLWAFFLPTRKILHPNYNAPQSHAVCSTHKIY